MRRVFALDVLACPRCGGRLRAIATVQDPAVVRAILAHLGLAPGPDSPGPAPPQPDHTAATGYPPGLSERLPINDGAGRQGSRLPRSRAP
jgi:uncharacterized protein YbaR (Trm112 family)